MPRQYMPPTGAETFLHTLLSRLQASLAFCATLGALSSLRLDDAVRNRAGDALVPNSKAGGLVSPRPAVIRPGPRPA